MFQKGVGRLDNWHPGRNWQQWHAGRFEHAGSRIYLARLDHGILTLFPYLTLHFLWSAQNFFCIHKILALRSADSLAINHDLREIIILFLSLILNDKKKIQTVRILKVSNLFAHKHCILSMMPSRASGDHCRTSVSVYA